jgi:hypothetical protein
VITGSLITSIVNGHWKGGRSIKRKKPLPLLLLAQLATCFLLVLALVLLLVLPPTAEQRWKQQSALLCS